MKVIVNSVTGERLRWRVVVQSQGRLDPTRPPRALAWHVAECRDPAQADAHCPEGQSLLQDGADPGGHCLIDSLCAVCPVEQPELIQAEEADDSGGQETQTDVVAVGSEPVKGEKG